MKGFQNEIWRFLWWLSMWWLLKSWCSRRGQETTSVVVQLGEQVYSAAGQSCTVDALQLMVLELCGSSPYLWWFGATACHCRETTCRKPINNCVWLEYKLDPSVSSANSRLHGTYHHVSCILQCMIVSKISNIYENRIWPHGDQQNLPKCIVFA